MAKSPVHLAPGLTLDGENFAFAGHGADLETVIARATSRATLDRQDAVVAEVNAACKMHASAWGAVLALDPQVAAITPDVDPLTVGPILVAAAQRAALPCADPCALVLAVAEAARLHTLAALPKPRKVEPPKRVRQRALLAVPCTVEAVGWQAGLRTPTSAAAVVAAQHEHAARIVEVAALNADRAPGMHYPAPAAPSVLPAVRLRGGLLGRSGVTLRPAGESSLAWAAATWGLSCASLEGPRKVAEPKASAAKIAELPVVVLRDGAVVTLGTLSAADVGAALALETPGTAADLETADAFMIAAAKRRDEAYKLEGEASDLAMVADPSWTLHDVPEAQQAAVRGLAVALLAGDARAPTFEHVRDVARPAFKTRTRTPRSTYQRIGIWAEALLAEVKRVERAALVAREAAELQRRVDKRLEQEARTQARKRAA